MSRAKRAGVGAPGPSQRQLRMGELLRHALSEIMARGEFRDPVLAHTHITVTEVRPSPDLKNATVFVTPLGGGDTAAVVAALQHARGYLRAQIAGMIEAKFTPNLSFKPDTSFAAAERIESLLAKERD
ncbi:MAG: 30S ribosome-binding factor RbfA [Alphaproteobacteria bacterium]|nr:30S ribosome-binding factor RbfA [Alphaproteobacteria bacterium]MCB9928894.1 30S ribosome-binding factor RbfA [Alphaproteobacteria bacterium]